MLNFLSYDSAFYLVWHQDKTIKNELLKSIKKYKTIKEAIVVDSPNETAITILYEEYIDFKNYKHNIFSTKKAAINWLLF